MTLMYVLLLFLDGVGLGEADEGHNPFACGDLPNLRALLEGRRLVRDTPSFSTDLISFVPTDPCLGVHGRPQSATGQATIVTGLNVPQIIGKHWGPKPNSDISHIIRADNLLQKMVDAGHSVRLANAYPDSFFESINSGRRSYSALQLAFVTAGVPLYTADDLRARRAFPADLTGHSWPSRSHVYDMPLYSPEEAGRLLAFQAERHSLILFDHWQSDIVGHRGTMAEAVELVERLDAALGGIMDEWNPDEGLVIITSDHGNLEDMGTRHHTINMVPTILIGHGHARLARRIHDLTDLAPAITEYLGCP